MIGKLLGGLTSTPGLILMGGIAAVVLVSWIDAAGEARGVERTEARVAIAVATERERQAIANQAAAAEAAVIVAELNQRAASLEAQLKENADAAARDPDAGRACLSADGVQRLNRIR